MEDIQSEEESPSDLPSEGDSEWECGGDCMHCNTSQDEFCFICRFMPPQWRRKPCAAQSNTPLRGVDSREYGVMGRKATYRKRGTVKKRGVVKKRKAPTPELHKRPRWYPSGAVGRGNRSKETFWCWDSEAG